MNSASDKLIVCYFVLLVSVLSCLATITNARLLRSPFYDEYGSGLDGYGRGGSPSGQRAIIKVRGARHPIDGTAPEKLAIEDDPYRGPFPRGIYDNVDNYRGNGGGYPYGGANLMHQGSYGGYGRQPYQGYGMPSRIAVTGAFPYGYGSRYGI